MVLDFSMQSHIWLRLPQMKLTNIIIHKAIKTDLTVKIIAICFHSLRICICCFCFGTIVLSRDRWHIVCYVTTLLLSHTKFTLHILYQNVWKTKTVTWTLRNIFIEIWIKIQVSFIKIDLNMSSARWRTNPLVSAMSQQSEIMIIQTLKK